MKSFLRFLPYDCPLLVFIASAMLGMFVAYDPSLGVKTLVFLGLGVLLYALVSRLGIKPSIWVIAAASMTGISTLLAVYFITQSGHIGYDDKVGVITWLTHMLARFVPDLSFWKPFPNSIGTIMEGSLFLAIGLAFTLTRRGERIASWAAVGLIGLALFLSASRGGWLAVFGAGLIWGALYWRPARYIALALGAALVCIVVFVLVRGNINAIGEIPVANTVLGPLFIRPDRLAVYQNSLALIQDTPLTGIGPGGQFALVYSRYELLLFVPFLYYSHNFFLETWLEQGLLGIIAIVWLFTALYSWVVTFQRRKTDLRFESTWIGLTAMLLHGMSDARPFQDLWCWLPFFILFGLNGALVMERSNDLQERKAWLAPLVGVAVLMVVVALSLGSLNAVVLVNRGSLLQTRADLTPGLADTQRAAIREEAAGLFERALLVSPVSRSANQRLGIIRLGQENYPSAIHLLERARQTDPTHFGTRKALGLAYAYTGRVEEAVALLKDVPGIMDELNYWAWDFCNKNLIQSCLNTYRTSLALNPNQPEVRNVLDKLQPGQNP
jgi:O-antigen ligase